ncbi:MAG TPA: hypothetical protein VJT80_13240 [Steroidobacteraceae bacterium]|nr:hypothetical protein [Steroidobacteraceae bacterium]
MLSSRRVWKLAFVAFAGAMFGVSVAADAPSDIPPDTPIAAIWQIQQIDFLYNSTTVRYSCGNLQRRIAAILQAVGAHASMGVELGCRSGELVRYANVHLTLAVPVAATEENIRAATNFDTRDELVARLHQTQLPSAEQIVRFPASWRTVALSRSPPLSLGPGDCDLLRAMRDDVFPRLHVRVVSSGLRCGGGADTRIPPRINVNALMPSRT